MPKRKNRDNILLVALLLMMLLVTGCRSTRNAQGMSQTGSLVPLVQQMQALSSVDDGALSGKLKIEASVGANTFSVGGNIGIERGVGLQLAATALGLFEVARLEATPVDICLVNKVAKEYARADYSPASLLGQAGLRYNTLQAVFLNEPFLPDGKSFLDSLTKLTLYREGGNIVAVTPEYKKIQYTFTFDASTGELRRSEGVYNKSIRVVCDYSDFKQIAERSFPSKIDFEIQGLGQPLKLGLRLSNIKYGNYKFKKNSLSSYRQITVDELLKGLDK